MFGIDLPGLIRFFMQIGVAIAAAAALWGFVFAQKKQHTTARLLVLPFLAGVTLFLISWLIANFYIYAPSVLAHEGIRLHPTVDLIRNGFSATMPLIAVLAVFTLIGLLIKLRVWFLGQFLILSAIILLTVFTGEISRVQIFYSLHGWHSVLTTGTVVIVDFLFIATLYKNELKKFVYSFFPIISGAIWVGLGLDFIANMFVFEEAFHVTQQFLFTQTVVAIIIINGALLSGKLNKALMLLIKPDGSVANLSPRINKIAAISGTVSIISWLTITFIDTFELTATYMQLLVVYVIVIVLAYFAKQIAEHGLQKYLQKNPTVQ